MYLALTVLLTPKNAALEKYESALDSKNVKEQIALQPAIRFNGGGHINHSVRCHRTGLMGLVVLEESHPAKIL